MINPNDRDNAPDSNYADRFLSGAAIRAHSTNDHADGKMIATATGLADGTRIVQAKVYGEAKA